MGTEEIRPLVELLASVPEAEQDDFSFSGSTARAVAELMRRAAERDAAERRQNRIEIPGDPAAHGGRWHRAANILNFDFNKFARTMDIPFCPGEWSWYAMLETVGIDRERMRAKIEAARKATGRH